MRGAIWPTSDGRLEGEFRAARAEAESRRLVVLAGVVLVVVVAFAFTDVRLVGSRAELLTLFGLRGLVVALSMAIGLVARRDTDYRTRDRIAVAWVLAFVALDLFAVSTRPPDYFGYVALTPLIVLAFYTVVPAPPRALTAAAAVETLGALALAVGSGTAPPAVFALAVGLAAANAIGLTTMWDLNRLARDEFLALRAETIAREAFERALDEIRTLHGILPICAWCKKVRDDEGAWQQVEAYVTEHSGASFSHGVCPSCEEDHYAEI